MVELILDQAGQKGTGRWTVESAFELGIPSPTLSAAVEARMLSFFKEDRRSLSKGVDRFYPKLEYGKDVVISYLRDGLLFVFFNAFLQGGVYHKGKAFGLPSGDPPGTGGGRSPS